MAGTDDPEWLKRGRGQSGGVFNRLTRPQREKVRSVAELMQPRVNDGPQVTQMRDRLREVDRQVGYSSKAYELRPPGAATTRDRDALLKERDALRDQLTKLDKVRTDFNEKGDKSREDR